MNLQRLADAAQDLALRSARRVRGRWHSRRGLRSERLSGPLAIDGGLPVRDTTTRPWPGQLPEPAAPWRALAPVLEDLFRGGRGAREEDLPAELCRRWADSLGVRHALLLPSGLDALRLALAAALDRDGLGPTEPIAEVIVPSLAPLACSAAALDRRLAVALVDVDPRTLTLDPARVEEAIVPGRTRALLAVHLFGQPCDMAALGELAARHDLALIEDASGAQGAIHEQGRAGTLGAAAAFELQTSRSLAGAEGGALVTDDTALFERACAFPRPPASEYLAAVLLQRLDSLEERQALRAERAALLREALVGVDCVEPLAFGPGTVRHGVDGFALRYRGRHLAGLDLADFLRALEAEGVPATRPFAGRTLARQPLLTDLLRRRPEYLRVLPTPVADRAVDELLCLPPGLFGGSEEDVLELAVAFAKIQAQYSLSRRVQVPVNGRLAAASRERERHTERQAAPRGGRRAPRS